MTWVHEGAGLCFTLREAAQNQTAGIAEVSQPLPHQNAKENQTWCKSGEEGEEKHLKGAQELKFHFLYAFLPSIQ